jgi:hypothetical protein
MGIAFPLPVPLREKGPGVQLPPIEVRVPTTSEDSGRGTSSQGKVYRKRLILLYLRTGALLLHFPHDRKNWNRW